MSNFIGLLDFRDNNTKAVVVDKDGKEYPVWNMHDISIHTYGYPQMNATINSIYTCYVAGTICECFIFSDGEVWISNVIRYEPKIVQTNRKYPKVELIKILDMLPDFLKQKQ